MDEWKGRTGFLESMSGRVLPTYGMVPSPRPRHQQVVLDLASALRRRLGQLGATPQGRCRVYIAPLDVRLGPSVVQPDILILCDLSRLGPRGVEGPPDLVVEVLSPSTRAKDLNRKRRLYEAFQVPEFLLVDPPNQEALLLRLDQDRYTEAAHATHGQRLPLLGGRLVMRLDLPASKDP